MAASLSDLITWRDRLIEARLSGVREAQDSNGERIRYATDSEMASALASVDRMIAGTTAPTPHTIRFQTSKGI